MVSVVVLGVAQHMTRATVRDARIAYAIARRCYITAGTGQRGNDQVFESLFTGISCRHPLFLPPPWIANLCVGASSRQRESVPVRTCVYGHSMRGFSQLPVPRYHRPRVWRPSG